MENKQCLKPSTRFSCMAKYEASKVWVKYLSKVSPNTIASVQVNRLDQDPSSEFAWYIPVARWAKPLTKHAWLRFCDVFWPRLKVSYAKLGWS
jgi:hypothetical protein